MENSIVPRPPVEVEVGVADGDWFDDDPRWATQRLELFSALRAAPQTSVRPATESGKGVAETVIVALGSAGAFTAMIEIFKVWIGNRPHRSVTVTVKSGESTVVYDSRNISAAEANDLIEEFGA